ncbi:MAG: hypothetical protein MN733_38945 [Nitrososphaera sp.]|nr:hypothetical protein [Nitrososphaera sp.]
MRSVEQMIYMLDLCEGMIYKYITPRNHILLYKLFLAIILASALVSHCPLQSIFAYQILEGHMVERLAI